MLLSILIPTYNRAEFLHKNLVLLVQSILEGHYFNEIELVISNNKSIDNTHEMMMEFQSVNPEVSIKYFKQDKNIGLEANALFVLEKAAGRYVMYLGDDDFISFDYLLECMEIIRNDSTTTVITPNFIPVDIKGEILAKERSSIRPTKVFKSGFKSCLLNSWKGHQLSGLVFKNEGLLKSYKERNMNNIYLFIYFVAYSCLIGTCYFITKYPVKVTQPIKKKDWGYGNDGLVNEIFDNYKKLKVNILYTTILQIYFFHKQPWRLWMYAENKKKLFQAFFKIWDTPNSTLLFKLLFPLQVTVGYLRLKLRTKWCRTYL